MTAYVVIREADGLVVNRISYEGDDFDPGPGLFVVQSDVAGIGWTYADGVFSEPPPQPEGPEAPAEPIRITRLRLKNELLTLAELLAYNKAKRDVAALTAADYGNPAKALLVQAEILLDYMEDATAIELDNPKTIMGVSQLMVALGILTSARAAQVLANEEP
ncbi:hypothetical protein [uncultured Brevundimonas sp.]|uniref:hypothetical protein n=1 Tax=uncultured Brevundimonas sp. TaxID=213418 RepID=UPI0025D9704A|nr:hypothetical protein [uncultured Brevundimonas sp.]